MPVRLLTSAFSLQNQRPEQNDRLLCEPFEGGLIAAVADGCGSFSNGDDAAETAIRHLKRLTDASNLGAYVQRGLGGQGLCAAFDGAIQELQGFKGATTCTAMLLYPNGQGFVAHIGDSVLFRVRLGKLERLTEAHRAGQTRNVLSRAIHGYGELARASTAYTVANVQSEPGDVYLLATDGCYESLEEQQLRRWMDAWALPPDAGQASPAEQLVQASIAAGAKDNSTAIVIRVEAP